MNNLRDPQTFAIIGAAMSVHNELGCGFLESVYQEALALEFIEQQIPFHKEVDLPIFYRNRKMEQTYRADFICYGQVIVELKALSQLTTTEDAQIINYLKATKLDRGLLINFGSAQLGYKRFNNSRNNQTKLG